MCCSCCCACERLHVDDNTDLHNMRRLVRAVVTDLDLAFYGVRVVPLDEDRPSLDARMETWRDALIEKMTDEVVKVVGLSAS